MTTKEILETYYKGFAQKQGWETVISDEIQICWRGHDKGSANRRQASLY